MTKRYSVLITIPCLLGLLLFCVPSFLQAQQESYGVGSWDSDSLGNHRAVVEVSDSIVSAARAQITWRRRDENPQDKRIIVVDAKTNQKIDNVYRVDINRITGDIIFEPTSGAGIYYVYYMPYRMKGRSNYPTGVYPGPEFTAESVWIQKHNLPGKSGADVSNGTFAEANVQEIQAINRFNSFYPMELVASQHEVDSLESAYKTEPYLLFPEKRTNSIRMFDDLPYKWIKEGPSTAFEGKANRGEFYVFQVGLYAFKSGIEDVEIEFQSLKPKGEGTEIAASNFSSFNTEGTDWDGEYFNKTVPVSKGTVQPFWVGVQIPESTEPGDYKGSLTVHPENMSSRTIDLDLEVMDEVIADAGDDDIWRLSRLRWLNSKMAMNNKVVKPYIPIKREDNRLDILGRSVELSSNGLPKQVKSYFTPGVTEITKKSRNLLSSPFNFIVTDESGNESPLKGNGINYIKQDEGLFSWTSTGKAGALNVKTQGRLESDGFMHYKVTVQADQKTTVQDIRMEIPVQNEAAEYMMGLGLKGGKRPEEHLWKWDQTKHQEGAWIGDVNIGFQYQLRDTNYVRPLNTNFYQQQPLKMPPSWYNQGRGGTDIIEKGNETVLVRAYSGKRTIEKGEKVNFVFNLLLTPFKTINTSKHWQNRYYHAFEPVNQVARTGASVINVHHANNVNPYINYPFIHTKQMKEYVDKAHLADMKVKIYYTIRELSNRAPELFALRSLNHEILSDGEGGGYSWLQEHLVDDYIAAWFVPKWKDAAVINSGMSRWHNYYVEGLDWLVQNMEIDGLYIDDLAFDRTTMKRVRKVLNRGEGEQLIDMHSANQYNERDGFTNSANLYMEHFPYIDRLWFGEYFEYDLGPDYWLVETSGIPFGLMGQMLQDGGNPWRGMIYGMTARAPWSGDPTPLWKLWDAFGIQKARMIPYWSPRAPIKSGNDKVKATSYVRKGESTLLILASWADNTVDITPQIDWNAIGLDPQNAVIEAPKIEDLQGAGQYQVDEALPIAPASGKILIIKEK